VNPELRQIRTPLWDVGADARGTISVFRKPATPDPFVNAGMTSVGPGADGRERFWISCVNTLKGATSFLIDEEGGSTVFRWKASDGIRSIYSVAQEDPDTLWVTGGGTAAFIRLTLSSGQWEAFPRAAGRFVTAGMALDPDTGKLFCGAQTALESFDTRSRTTVRTYGEGERPPENHHYDHWRLPDGTYGFIMETPGLSYLRWDPKAETVRWWRLTDDGSHPAIGLVRKLKYVEGARLYLPHFGWLDGMTGTLTPHAHPPEEEACWLGLFAGTVYGIQYDELSASARLVAWNPDTGQTRVLFTVPDTPIMNCALTRDGRLVLVDLYGCFRRYALESGSLELTRSMESPNEHSCNVILPLGADRVAGAPFIAQNFWVFDTQEESGFHAGRAAGMLGQIDDAVAVGGRAYFAAYGGGQLTEYDPERPHGFPRNPCIVAQNGQGQHGAGMTTDGQIVWVAFKPKYGTLDGAMIRYDTATGRATYRNGAVPAQHLIDPLYDPRSGCLVAGSSCLSDCSTAVPVHHHAFAILLDPLTLEVAKKVAGPPEVPTIQNRGPLGDHRWLMQGGEQLLVFDTEAASLVPYQTRSSLPQATIRLAYSGRPGLFLIQIGDSLQIWDAGRDTFNPTASLEPGFVSRWWVHGPDVTFDCGIHAAVWRGFLGDGSG
jgi:hypothetical protein